MSRYLFEKANQSLNKKENEKKGFLFVLKIIFLCFIIGEIYSYVDSGRHILDFEFGFMTILLFIRSVFVGFLIIASFNFLKEKITTKWGKKMKNLIIGLIVTGWGSGAIVSIMTENEYIPAIIVFVFTVLAVLFYIFNDLDFINKKRKMKKGFK